MDHWHCQRCGAEQVTAPLSAARTKLAKSRHKLASHIFSNVTLFFIYFFFFIHFSGFHSPPPSTPSTPSSCVHLNTKSFHITSWWKGGKKNEKSSASTKQEKAPVVFVYVAAERQFSQLFHILMYN